jgi:hypothetical protein
MTTTKAGARADASAKTLKDAENGIASSLLTSNTGASISSDAQTSQYRDGSAYRPEPSFHAFDALYCTLTCVTTTIKPLFPDDRQCALFSSPCFLSLLF